MGIGEVVFYVCYVCHVCYFGFLVFCKSQAFVSSCQDIKSRVGSVLVWEFDDRRIIVCITLPDDYRTFISEIGNGGFGPGYGLLPLDKAIVDFKLKDKPNISLNEKFPYQDSWNEEWITSFNWDEGYPETEIVDAYISTSHIAGSLQISHFGHGCTFLLVVNGNEKGHIWFDGRADYSGLVPKLKDGQRISFIEWYITFLDMEIENINESLTNSTTA